MVRWLILGVAVVGILVAALLPTKVQQEAEPSSGDVVDAGVFVLLEAGVPILEEEFELVSSPTKGYILISEARLAYEGEEATLGQQYHLDPDLVPQFYQMALATPLGPRILTATARPGGIDMDLWIGGGESTEQVSESVDVEGDLMVIDNNVISHFVVALLAARLEAIDREFTAAVPQALLVRPARLEGPNAIEILVNGEPLAARRYDLRIGETRAAIVTLDGRMIGLEIAADDLFAYRADTFPNGFVLPEEVQESSSGAPGSP